MKLFSVLFLLSIILAYVNAHGYLAEPPARSSAWLFDKDFAECCTYYNHMEMFCGGTINQWQKHGGKCGICGEEWDAEKKFEKGGEMYLGKIVKTYEQGEAINATVHVTANHYGWFEFRICNVDGWETDANQECFNKTVISFSEINDTRLHVKNYSSPAIINFKLQLPKDLTCNHCVLQWKYRCGNRWGIDEATNNSCMGCGVVQEHFFGCSDIAIKKKGNNNNNNNNNNNKNDSKEDKKADTTAKQQTTRKNDVNSNTNNNNANNNPDEYNGCRSKLYYGKKVNLSKAVSLYCSMVCKTQCAEDNTELDAQERIAICKQTCPTICSCE